MRRISLEGYNISVGSVSDALPRFLEARTYSRLLVIVDEHTETHCLPLVRATLENHAHTVIRIPAGERHKDLDSCQLIWRQMMQAGADRKALTINLGGGVIGDMGGFCASAFKRGMDFVQIPTTLLSQVDASIGGKLGIDFMQVKNSIGLFRNPRAVFIDPAFLQTLPFDEIRSGFAEIIKHSLIADAEQWSDIRRISDLNTADWSAIIPPSLMIKKRVVEEDPFERGLRKALNFGHTIGHAIEGHALETDRPLLHGEAIAIGMICEAYLSHRLVGLPEAELEQISRYILSIYASYPLDPVNFQAYLALMKNDKKNEDGQINFSLIDAAGSVRVNQTCGEELIFESLEFYRQTIG